MAAAAIREAATNRAAANIGEGLRRRMAEVSVPTSKRRTASLRNGCDLFFRGVKGTVRVLPGKETARTVAVLRRALGGWPHECRPVASSADSATPEPRFLVEALDEGAFLLHGASPEATDFSPFRPGDPAAKMAPGYSHEPSLACLASTLAIELVAVHEEQAGFQMGLHAAAATREGRTLLFCGRHRAGKSVLVARLQLAGWQGLGDDMLGLTADGELLSYALAPRLRLPLPPCPGLAPLLLPDSPFAACRDDRYLCCDPLALPRQPWGTRCSPSAIMVLDRRDEDSSADSGIFMQAQQEDMGELLRRFLLRDGRAGQALRTVDALLRRVPCRLLRYRTADEALRLLNDWLSAHREGAPFADPPLPEEAPSRLPENLTTVPDAPAYAGGMRGPRIFCRRGARAHARHAAPRRETAEHIRRRQRPDVIFRQNENGGFLARDEDAGGREGRIFQLNRMGCALWQLWREPGSDAELSALLAEAFPHISPERIRRDVTALRQRLCAAGLLIDAEEASPSRTTRGTGRTA